MFLFFYLEMTVVVVGSLVEFLFENILKKSQNQSLKPVSNPVWQIFKEKNKETKKNINDKIVEKRKKISSIRFINRR